jgi:hypothetical protein
MRANAARLAFLCCQSPASIAFARGGGDLPLLKASKGATLAPKAPESGECRINEGIHPGALYPFLRGKVRQ